MRQEVIEAVQHVRKLRGVTQPHLMRASDGHLYAVKFRNNPVSPWVPFNELFATRLAQAIGLPVPEAVVIHVNPFLVAKTSELAIERAGHCVPCESGPQFGSRYILEEAYGAPLDYLPSSIWKEARNIEVFAGALAFDLWTGNQDSRQAVYWRKPNEHGYSITFIDNSHCFDVCGDDFSFKFQPSFCSRTPIHQSICRREVFEPWLARIESLSRQAIADCARKIPRCWYLNPRRPKYVSAALYKNENRVRTAVEALCKSVAFKHYGANYEPASIAQAA